MTDAEWAVIEPLLPAPGWMAGKGGCPGSYCRRDIVDGIRYLVHNGCVWRALPADLPHRRTMWGYVHGWHESGATSDPSASSRPPSSDDPDEMVFCPPAACCGCGAGLAGEPVTAQRRHQVTGIEPAPAPKVTEYVAQAKECPGCGAR